MIGKKLVNFVHPEDHSKLAEIEKLLEEPSSLSSQPLFNSFQCQMLIKQPIAQQPPQQQTSSKNKDDKCKIYLYLFIRSNRRHDKS